MNGKPFALALLLMISAMTGCIGHEHEHEVHDFHGMEYNPASPATDFTLTDQNGQSVSLSDIHNKVVVVAFTYTSCPDVCPIDLSKINLSFEMMENRNMLQVVFVSVDPARDIGTLDQFASAFNSSFLGLTAHDHELETISKSLGCLLYTSPSPRD